MSAREIVRRLRAWHEGRPTPRYSTLHHSIAADDDTLVVAFVRMAGETRPWGIAFGRPGAEPELLSVPDGRSRDDVSEIAAAFGRVLLRHLQTPGFDPNGAADAETPRPLRQVWLPNDSHREMLHHLAYAYATTTFGEHDREVLNALGRTCGWLFRESERVGQQHVVVAARALADAYVFPCDDLRQAHLDFLLAWLETPGDRDDRLAAAGDEERRSVSITLDPALDREGLVELVGTFNDSRRAGRAREQEQAERAIASVLEGELRRRFDLSVRARAVLLGDSRPENPFVAELAQDSLAERWRQCLLPELQLAQGQKPYFASVETEWTAAGAAERYFAYQASGERVARTLCHGDAELLAEVIDSGDGLVGRITRVHDEGVGRATIPVWEVHAEELANPRLREGSKVCLVGARGRVAEVRSLKPHASGGLTVALVITKLKMKIKDAPGALGVAPVDARWVGQRISLVATSGDGISSRRAQLVWNKDGPGAWLTHSQPPRRQALPASPDEDVLTPVSVS